MHAPVLREEISALFQTLPVRTLVDGTVGFFGHSSTLLRAIPGITHYFGFDRDPRAIRFCRTVAEGLSNSPRCEFIQAPFSRLVPELRSRGVTGIDALLLDFGVNSAQIDDPDRGFSFQHDGPLDMRMDDADPSIPTAADLLATLEVRELTRIFRELGEEPRAFAIAKAIDQARQSAPILTTGQLGTIIRKVKGHGPRGHHPATLCFQALRLRVNNELGEIDALFDSITELLAPGSLIACISFHSLEDRRVKCRFREWAKSCVCPPLFPVCRCDKKSLGKILTPRPITPGETEIQLNPRSRSARLRVFKRMGGPS